MKKNKYIINQYVYVVSAGEASEGDSPSAVFDSLQGARNSEPDEVFKKVAPNQWKDSRGEVDEKYITRLPLLVEPDPS